MALWQAGFHAFAAIALFAGVVTLAYFLSMQRRVFFGKEKEEFSGVGEAGAGVLVPELALAGLTIAIGVGFPFVLRFVVEPIQKLLW
jgi:formate hydrogenlyase subunit 3/multisubunit Na+/H+ antiporter MnhD subunit